MEKQKDAQGKLKRILFLKRFGNLNCGINADIPGAEVNWEAGYGLDIVSSERKEEEVKAEFEKKLDESERKYDERIKRLEKAK